MAVMLSKTYDALIAAGAPEEKARAAAEELAAYESRFAKIETDLGRDQVDARRCDRRSLHRWSSRLSPEAGYAGSGQPSQSQMPRPITHSWSAGVSQGNSSVNKVIAWR